MKLGKHTLLIDGNYFIHSRLFVLPRTKDTQLLADKDGQAQFMRKLSIDFASEVRKMTPFIDQIVVAVDSKSWRKDLFPEAQYKGTRVQDESINWEGVFNVYTEFQSLLAKKGVIVQQTAGAEADDILYGWSTHLNNEGKNCIVWTGDRDLIQLVNYNQATDAYTLWYYNSKRKLIAFEGFDQVLNARKTENLSNEELLFNIASVDNIYDKLKQDFQEWITKNGVEVEEINCDDFVFGKILQGDKSDNIKSVVTWSKKGANGKIRNFSITEKQALVILDQYKKEEGEFHIDHFFNRTQVTKLVDIIYRVVKQSNPIEIAVRFNQNLDLILLHYNTVPESIQKAIYVQVENYYNIEPNIVGLSQMEKILEGTDWTSTKGEGAPKEFDPFASLSISETSAKPAVKKLNELF